MILEILYLRIYYFQKKFFFQKNILILNFMTKKVKLIIVLIGL
ncbi:uncharacterized protein METZ01_LOCUS106339 [marine metagenome]|uniref:Uncharacterized protein n=1 Tax=marine metagenome TaxID=408172 RepID=A0A381WLY0_9ZZZZ